MPENFCYGIFRPSSVSLLLYLYHIVFNEKWDSMVLKSYGHSLVAWRRRVQIPRVVPWYWDRQLNFDGKRPTHSSLSFFRRSGLTPWTGALKIFHCTPCRRRTCTCGCLLGSHRITWTGGFPQLRSPSWGEHISSWSSGLQIQCLNRISCELDTQLLGEWALVGKRPSVQSRSWIQVWSPRSYWLNHLGFCLW